MTRDGKQTLAVKVELLGRTVDLTVPTEVTISGGELSAKGEFELNHADLGMKPFSVMMGALQVGEKFSFSYDVKARRETPLSAAAAGRVARLAVAPERRTSARERLHVLASDLL